MRYESLNFLLSGSGRFLRSIPSSGDGGACLRRTVTSSNDGHALMRWQAPSATHHDRSVWTLEPRGVSTNVNPGQPVPLVHSRQFSHTSCATLTNFFFGTNPFFNVAQEVCENC